MPSFDIDTEEITAFDFEETYLFRTCFDENRHFNQLETYYNSDKCRFEILEDGLPSVRQTLEEFFYELEGEDMFQDYLVVADKEADASEIRRNGIMRKQKGQQEISLMKDKSSVTQAIEQGAVPVQESQVSVEVPRWKTH